VGRLLQLLAIGFLFLSPVQAGVLNLKHGEMKDVVKIARAISVVRPNLEDAKYLEYGLGIYRASRRYNVEPSVLIAITQQETGFREGLPEGKAGELGICQILKNWLKNPRFRAEFRNAREKDFASPAKSFMFSAWILSDLKNRITTGSLPYWSFYNANKFHNRFKYFMAVNRYVAALKRNENRFNDAAVAAIPDSEAEIEESEPVANPAPLVIETKPVAAPEKLKAELKPKEAVLVPRFKVSTQWIPDTLQRIRAKVADRKKSGEQPLLD